MGSGDGVERGGQRREGERPREGAFGDRRGAGRAGEARGQLEVTAKEAERAGRYYRLLEMRVLLAAAGTGGEASDALKQALAIAEPEGYVWVFLMESEALLKQLKAVIKDSGSLQPRLLEFARRILSFSP